MSRLWKKFSRLTEDCYCNMISADQDKSVWHKTFDKKVKAIEEARSSEPSEHACMYI